MRGFGSTSRAARTALTGATAAALLLTPILTGSATAQAQTRSGASEAAAAASRARAKVDALLERYQAASAEVDVGVRALSAAFTAAGAAEVTDEAAAAQHRRARINRSAQIRAVYVAGGAAGLTASVLGASSPDEALWRVSTADRVLGVLFAQAQDEVTAQAEAAKRTRRRVLDTDAATAAQAAALNDLHRRAEAATTALEQARATLSTLDTRARQVKAAEDSARQIAAAQAAAREARRLAMGEVTALAIPVEYQRAYQAAALTCPGLPWTLLAGVGQVETGHGRNNGPSSAGAIGPMQFMPRTFAAYAMDGDGDGVLDAWDPQDAIFTAARYLCESGARTNRPAGSATWKHAALLAYNHAEWYVDLVLAAEQTILDRSATTDLP